MYYNSGVSISIFRNLNLEIEWVLRYKAMELESLRYIVRRLETIVVVRPTYVSFSLGTVSQETFKHIYDICPMKKFSGGRRWWLMKGPKALGTILVNSCTNSNLDIYL